jgi:hypothetical protein
MPSSAPLLLAVALALVLVISAVAKLSDQGSTRSVTVLLRLPSFLRGAWFARALPVAELALAVGLLAPWTALARVAWGLATILFALYLGVIVRAMTFDPRPSCGCFGRIGNQRVTGHTVVRNVLLLAASTVVLGWVGAGHTVPTTVQDLDREGWAWVLSATAVVAIAVLVVASPKTTRDAGRQAARAAQAALAAQAARASEQATHPKAEDYVRRPNPSSLLIGPDGEPVLLDALARRAAQLVLFLSPGSEPTGVLAPRVPGWTELLGPVELTVALGGSASGVAEAHPELAPLAFVDPFSRATAEVVGHAPAAVLLGADGLLAGGPVHGVAEITDFVEEILDQLGASAPAEAGVPVVTDAR